MSKPINSKTKDVFWKYVLHNPRLPIKVRKRILDKVFDEPEEAIFAKAYSGDEGAMMGSAF